MDDLTGLNQSLICQMQWMDYASAFALLQIKLTVQAISYRAVASLRAASSVFFFYFGGVLIKIID